MPKLEWYVRRLRAMSAREIAWRVQSSARDAMDQALFAAGRPRRPAFRPPGGADTPPFRVTELPVGAWAAVRPPAPEATWRDRLLDRADRIAQNRLSFFSFVDLDLGEPIDWNRDHETGQACPMAFAPSIDYRDATSAGDAKVVWEPSRHHQLVVLARAYRASGEARYAEKVVELLDSWLDGCPFPRGMNWRSPLELGVRLINWTWAVDLIRESDLVAGPFRDRLLESIHLHVWETARKYSRGSSANNHLIGEAAGVFIATSYFDGLPDGAERRAESREILAREILAQTYPDGPTRELAPGYHIFVLQFFALAGLVARARSEDFAGEYWQRLEAMVEFVAALAEGGERLPLFNDADDGYVLDVGAGGAPHREVLALGAALLGRVDLGETGPGDHEPGTWLPGVDPPVAAASPGSPTVIRSRAFPDAGLYLLQNGAGEGRVSVLFDCGPLGFGAIAAHGHADALSFTLRAFGRDILVDPGTADYFRHPEWRRYFRSTAAHNTVGVDGLDQSEMEGPFLWGRRARAVCRDWKPTATGGTVEGEHDGYTRLADPVRHRRRVSLEGRSLTLTDELAGSGRHVVALHFHLAEDCQVVERQGARIRVSAPPATLVLDLDPRLEVQQWRASEDPLAGWVSRRYHERTPGQTLTATTPFDGPCVLRCRLDLSKE